MRPELFETREVRT